MTTLEKKSFDNPDDTKLPTSLSPKRLTLEPSPHQELPYNPAGAGQVASSRWSVVTVARQGMSELF